MTDPALPQFSPHTRNLLYEQRILVLDGELTDDNGVLLTSQLLSLASEDPFTTISLWIHSPGGSVPAMLAIRDVMRIIPCDVATVALGIACSAGQFILTAGTPGMRMALPHARILMHQGSAGIGGSTIDVEVQGAHLKHTRETVLRITASDTGQSYEQIFHDSLHDHWYTASEAVAYRLIDSIVDDYQQIIPQAIRSAGFTTPSNSRGGQQ